MIDKLTPKEEAFLTYYLSNGFNATAAAISAGYSETTAYSKASRLVKKPKIIEGIRAHQEKLAAKSGIAKDEIIKNLYAIMTSPTARNSDKIKASEVLIKALGYNEPDKVEHSGEMINKVIKVTYKGQED